MNRSNHDHSSVKEDVEGVKNLATEFKREQILCHVGICQHNSYPNFPISVLSELDMEKYEIWISQLEEEFAKL